VFAVYYIAHASNWRGIVKVIQRVFLASLFFMLTVLLSVWFYPGIDEEFTNYYSRVQGGIGSTTYTQIAIGALDIGSAFLCVSALFYGVTLVYRRRRRLPHSSAPKPELAETEVEDNRGGAQFKRRLLLIPIWLLAQYLWNLFSGMSIGTALDMMTSLNELWVSAAAVTVIVLYAKNYRLVFEGKGSKGKAVPKE
jgi:hypothetical protein